MKTVRMVYRSGIGITPDRPIREAAQIMERAGVGLLVVLDQHRPIGVVTDRDLVRRALARGLPGDARVDDVMTMPVVTVDADADDDDAVRTFATHAVRRLVVVDGTGAFVGVLSLDDLMVRLAARLSDLVRPVTAELLFAHRDAPVPATS